MRQSLEILQANALELQQLVRQEIETNPTLEEEPPESAEDAEEPESADGEEEGEDAPGELERLQEDWSTFSAEGAQAPPDPDGDARRRQFLE